MVPVLGIMSGGLSLLGGFFQSQQIKRITAERVRQMRLAAEQRLGQYTAGAAASGVEMTSSTVQNTLTRMRGEFERAIGNVEAVGASAATNTMLSAFGGALGSFGQNLYNASKVTAAFGEQPEVPPLELNLPGKKAWNWETGQDFNMLEER